MGGGDWKHDVLTSLPRFQPVTLRTIVHFVFESVLKPCQLHIPQVAMYPDVQKGFLCRSVLLREQIKDLNLFKEMNSN